MSAGSSMYEYLNERVIDLATDKGCLIARLESLISIFEGNPPFGDTAKASVSSAKLELAVIKAKDEQRRALDQRNAA